MNKINRLFSVIDITALPFKPKLWTYGNATRSKKPYRVRNPLNNKMSFCNVSSPEVVYG